MKKIKNSKKKIYLYLALFLAVFLLIILTYATEGLTKGKELTGAEVYSANCGKCHSERYPSERTDDEWKVIVNHMRVIAGMTAKEAKLVLQYLQENNAEE